MQTGWKIVPKNMVSLFKNPDSLPVPGLCGSQNIALLLVTTRPIAGEAGYGTVSSLLRSENPLEDFVLAHFTDNIIDQEVKLPEWFLSEEGANRRADLLSKLMKVPGPINNPQKRIVADYIQKASAAAENRQYADQLRIIHLAYDRIVEWMQQQKSDQHDYESIVASLYGHE